MLEAVEIIVKITQKRACVYLRHYYQIKGNSRHH